MRAEFNEEVKARRRGAAVTMQQPAPEPPAFVEFRGGRAYATLRGEGNPIARLHARSWAVGRAPSEAEIREAYTAAGFPAEQLDSAFRRKARWETLPEVAAVRFRRPVGSVLQQTELLLSLT